MTTPGSRRGWRRTAQAGVLVYLGLGAIAPTSAADLVTALPHEFVVGPAPGYAVARGVDARASRHANALPEVERARVVWQRQVPGGIGTNLLVDAEGRIFLAGLGRVTQLGNDGALQFSQAAPFSSAVAATLLTDGSRALLTDEGRVQAWSATGAKLFDIELEGPAPSESSSLLPLPDGGALVSLGEWLFEIDATRSVRSYARLPASIQHALVIDGKALVVDEQGRAFEWDRRELPRSIGAFGAPLSALAIDKGALLGLSSRRTLERLDRADGSWRELARLDPPGAAPVFAGITPGRWALLKYDGLWFTVQAEMTAQPAAPRRLADPNRHVELLADSNGVVAWWAADMPLHLETAPGVGRELAEVQCISPVGLVPAGPSRVVAACSSGAIWLIGPEARTTDESQLSGFGALAIGICPWNALYSLSL